jgi:hypothetical protein
MDTCRESSPLVCWFDEPVDEPVLYELDGLVLLHDQPLKDPIMGAIQMQLSSERSRRGSSKTDGRGHSMFDPTEIVPVQTTICRV